MYCTVDDFKKIKVEGDYYMPETLLNKFKNVRLEAKLAYAAILNTMIKESKSDDAGYAYTVCSATMIDLLKVIAHKKVDEAKMQGYIQELTDLDLLVVNDSKIYLKKVEGIL